MKHLQISRDGPASALCPEEEQTCRNVVTCIDSSSVTVMQTAKDRTHTSPRVSSRRLLHGTEALQLNFGASGVTKSECDPLRGFQLLGDG